MMNKPLARILLLCLLLVLAVGIGATIHFMSSQDKQQSNTYSKSISARLYELFPESEKQVVTKSYVDLIMRKIAHMGEYFLLSLVLFLFFYLLTKRVSIATILPVILCVGYAFFDEWFQRGSVGRASSYFDVVIDSIAVLMCVGACSVSTLLSRQLAKIKRT